MLARCGATGVDEMTLHRAMIRVCGVLRAAVLVLTGTAGCRDAKPPVEPLGPVNTSTVVSLPTFGVSTVTGAGPLLFMNTGRYAVLPHFAATTDFAKPADTRASVPDFEYVIGGVTGISARIAASTPAPRTVSAAEAFHLDMRALDREEAPRAIAYQRQLRALPPASLRVQSAQSRVLDTREFNVLSKLVPRAYTKVSARLVYTGDNILVYLDAQSPVTNGFTDAEYAAFGRLFDSELFPVDVAMFGQSSDIDGNGRRFVLFTPIVNRLTLSSGVCGTYVAGFFNGADLSGSSSANRAEILYQSVPGEPAGGPSCEPLSKTVLRNSAPATFIHEMQHLISYNQHVLLRSGDAESTWLNEGMSHIAEELGGLLYEARYPCSAGPPCPLPGRQSAAQIFPDSAGPFVLPNFRNAYDFFTARGEFSLTSPTSLGSLEERGVAWLFLRWLADQKGQAALTSLAQTSKVGTANVEAVTGESFAVLYADFLAATLLDHYPGAAAGQIDRRHSFTSRNLRAIYARLNLTAPAQFPTPYPLDVRDLVTADRLTPVSPARTRYMKPGSLELFQFTSTTPSAGLTFSPLLGAGFKASLNAQVTVVRLPE
jgi:hypothetical protein